MKSYAASGAPRPLSPARATAPAVLTAPTLRGCVSWVLALIVSAPVAHAQVLQGTNARSEALAVSSAASSVEARPGEIQLLVGRSTVLNMGQPITRVSLTSSDIADAMVTSHNQLLVHGKAPGTITMFVWERSGGIRRYEVVVQRDLSQLLHQVQQLFPGEPISVTSNGEHVVIAGTVSSKYVVDKAAEVAAGYVKSEKDVVNLLKQQEGIASQQVLLRVRFAEVSRSALTQLGASFFTGPGGFHDYVAQTSTQQFPTVNYDELLRGSEQGPGKFGGGRDTVVETGGKFSFSDLLNIFLFNNKYNVGTVIKALQDKGLFQSLAEPNLIAQNGTEASFLAGGEYPYPVVQGTGGGTSISIQFKEFGIRLNFTPTIAGGDLINLKVNPEVSSLDFSNAVTLQGFTVPAISTRRAETVVELRDGQTFAIAGLLNNTVSSQMRKIPGVGDIPILGWLFKSRGMLKNQTELVVMITPQILRQNSTGVSEGLPSLVEPYMGAPDKTRPNPEPYVGSPRYPASQDVRGRSGDTGSAVVESTPRPAPAAEAPAQPGSRTAAAPTPLTGEQKKAIERARKAEAKAADEQAEKDRKAAAEARKQQEKMAREQAKLEKELARRRAEADKRQAEQDRKRAAEIEAAERRLKAAEAEYQSALGHRDDGK